MISATVPVLLAMLSTTVLAADTAITTADGNGADAFIRQVDPDVMYGESEYIELKNHTGCTSDGETNFFNRKAYLRFDLSGLCNGGWVESATLSLEATAPPQPANATSIKHATFTFIVFGLPDGAVGDGLDQVNGWIESALNWNNAPANNSSPTSFDDPAVVLGSFDVTGSGVGPDSTTFSSPQLRHLLNTDQNGLVTIMMSRDTPLSKCESWVHGFAAKELMGSAPPTLHVQVRNAADVAAPRGVLDIDDVLTFLDAFAEGEGIADLAVPFGVLNIDDVLTFLDAFASGSCLE